MNEVDEIHPEDLEAASDFYDRCVSNKQLKEKAMKIAKDKDRYVPRLQEGHMVCLISAMGDNLTIAERDILELYLEK